MRKYQIAHLAAFPVAVIHFKQGHIHPKTEYIQNMSTGHKTPIHSLHSEHRCFVMIYSVLHVLISNVVWSSNCFVKERSEYQYMYMIVS